MKNEQFKDWLKKRNVRALLDLLEAGQSVKSGIDTDKMNYIIEELYSRELSEQETKVFENLMNPSFDDNYNESEIKRTQKSIATEPGRYSALKTITGLISALGFIIITTGIVFLVVALNTKENMMGIIAFFISVVIALPLLAFANLIHVFIDIEYNTRKTRDILEKRGI